MSRSSTLIIQPYLVCLIAIVAGARSAEAVASSGTSTSARRLSNLIMKRRKKTFGCLSVCSEQDSVIEAEMLASSEERERRDQEFRRRCLTNPPTRRLIEDTPRFDVQKL